MAGDWIKVEIATARKAEVARMAELLGVSRQACMGYLIDFWSWLDVNARTEVVPNMSRSCLDSLMDCPGISAAMEVVGWVEWDDEAVTMLVSNYDHHNGASAKTRAYEQKKKRKQREQIGDKTGTREEKRRTTTSLRSVVVLTTPTDEHVTIATKRGISCQAEFEKYRDWMAATGKKHRDQNAGFRNWLKNARAGPAGKESIHDKRAATARAMFAHRETTSERPDAIDGTAERLA